MRICFGSQNYVQLNGSGVGNTNGFSGITFTQAVPEPSTYALFGMGAIGMLTLRRKKSA